MKINPLHSLSLLYFFFLFYCVSSVAQNRFEKNYGGTGDEEAYSVLQTPDSGYIVAGFTTSYGAGNEDVYIVKTDKDGEVEWEKTYGGIYSDRANAIQATFDGGYIVGGWSQKYAGNGDADFYILKLNSDGDTIWTRKYGHANTTDWGHSIKQTRDSGYIMIGEDFRNLSDFWLLKLKPNGDTSWSRTYGGSSTEIGRDVQQTTDGGYIMVGNKSSNGTNAWIIKTDSNGIVEWEKLYGDGDANATAIEFAGENGYMVAGMHGDGGGADVYLLKLKPNGDTVWTKRYGDGGFLYKGQGMYHTDDGGTIITGLVFPILYLLKTDSSGNKEWDKKFGETGFQEGNSVKPTFDGGFIIAGYTDNFGNGDQMYLLKTDSKGDVVWVREMNIPKNLIIAIEPNPFSEKTILRFPNNYDFTNYNLQFTIYDITGRIATVSEINKQSTEIERSNLLAGMYLYQITSNKKIIINGKLIIK